MSIGPGAGFRALSERTGFLELEAIRRQRKGWQREASVALGTRGTRAGLAAYHESGAIGFSEDGAAAQARLVAHYLDERSQRPEASRVALAHTRAEVRSLNEAIRAGLQQGGALQDEAVFSAEVGRRSFAAGDRIVFLRNDRELGVKNGSLATVTAAAGKAGKSVDEMRAAQQAQIPAGRYGNAAEFGAICAFLCSVQAGYMTGQNVLADGGAYPGTF